MSLDLALMRPMIERERRLLVAAVLDAFPTARSAPVVERSNRLGSAARRSARQTRSGRSLPDGSRPPNRAHPRAALSYVGGVRPEG
jgi:hypothetical protein